jgi:hypothetical protein
MESSDPDYFRILVQGMRLHTCGLDVLTLVYLPMKSWAKMPAPSLWCTVANMVVNTDFNLMSALQFAVDYLKDPPHYCLRSLRLRRGAGIHSHKGPHASTGKLASEHFGMCTVFTKMNLTLLQILKRVTAG